MSELLGFQERLTDTAKEPLTDTAKKIETHAKIMTYIRSVLDNLDFLEVETPAMNMIAGGAAAGSFLADQNNSNMRLFMHMDHLKELVVGGLDRVYEIGKEFKNKGIDSHDPAFTTCKFYMADANIKRLINLTEEMLSGMVKELTCGYIIKYHAKGPESDPIEIDFTSPFRRIDIVEELEKVTNLNIPQDLSSVKAYKYLIDACARVEIKCPPPQTTASLLNKFVGHLLDENPTFVINHPEIMSPLAEWPRPKPGVTEGFKLFINNIGLCNAYTELNDPFVQRQRSVDQLKDQQSSNEAHDENCTALTGGWGLGIDQLAKLLTNSQNIQG